MDNLLSDYPVVIEFFAVWGEMGAMNHGNNIALRKRILEIRKSSPQG